MIEEWKSVVGYEDFYSISSLGKVRRDAPAPGTHPGYILKQRISNTGYPYVSLCRNAKAKGLFVHVLVAHAFLGSPPPRHEVNHKDSNTLNPALDNLEYVTRSGNMNHSREKGRFQPTHPPLGELHNKAKLTEKQVEEIRQSTESIITLAKKFRVNKTTIARARIGQNWKTVSTPPKPKLEEGVPRPWAKLTPEQGRAISQSSEPTKILAKQFGVSKTTICRLRHGRGHASKLTPEQVLAIREAEGTLSDIARQFGVSYVNIRYIKQRKTWKHL